MNDEQGLAADGDRAVAWEAYEARRTWLLGVHQIRDWNLKAYAITASGGDLAEGVLAAALDFVSDQLHEDRLEEQDLASALAAGEKFGFLVVHEGAEAVWLLLDLWLGDILHHHLYRAPLHRARHFEAAWHRHTAACVWELEIVHHERDAWVEHVLRYPNEPRYESYLAAALQIAAPRPPS